METLFAKSGPEWTLLEDHLKQVASASIAFARHLKMDEQIAYHGAIMHDLGKAHPIFQKRLKGAVGTNKVFRHEIASLFFLSAFPENEYHELIEMVVGHHKSVKRDCGEKGLLDLDDSCDYEEFHLGDWEIWSKSGIELLQKFGIIVTTISKEKALSNLEYVVDYCRVKTKEYGYSKWRGLLMGADHFASALINETNKYIKRSFRNPSLNYYSRKHPLYPLSLFDTSSIKKHTIVVACTGAGKTDYLFRRCKGRVFYTLPFQASINAMYKRVARELEKDNPELDIRVLHSASTVVKRKNQEEETVLQSLFGSSIKILTPHQLAAIAFGLKGFEALLLDLEGCDVILDEIHTYTGISQAIVLKIVEILKSNGCSIHIGTATMPTILYNKILSILGDDVLEVALQENELDKFNRHTIHKITSFEDATDIISEAILSRKKVLIVLNRVDRAQSVYMQLQEIYPDIPLLLLHSRFKRADRNEKERLLMGLDINEEANGSFNTSNDCCIVVSTQIVEVSLDISFDLMITEAAPLDAMIQRFGRINRKRTTETIGVMKDVYVIEPSGNKKEALPYELDIIQKSFDVLPNGEILLERELQVKIDTVFTEINFKNIEEHAVFKADGSIAIDQLTNRNKSILFELLDIDSVACICESDQAEYESSGFERRMELEIPVRYFSVYKMNQSQKGNRPFIIPDFAYNSERGLDVKKIREQKFDFNNQLL
ncbi:putative CRISPR-associated nuclease/helicase Cas3 [mine drainage metagenome]|uniref:Putative CRISPR-associated nuclease/helicase Cas3 n=1 Tax=mine drainage metagenome TaxID=410659 RepID=A0A1J5T7C3_9ZZZZ